VKRFAQNTNHFTAALPGPHVQTRGSGKEQQYFPPMNSAKNYHS